MSRPAKRLSVAAALPLACVLDMVFAGPASAHIKWFCVYDVASQPVGLENVLCPDFEVLTGLSLLGLLTGCAVEGTVLGDAVLRAFDQVTSIIRDNLEIIFRAACAFFFVSIWAAGGILLTPELKTDSIWIGVLQLAIAAGMVSRRTMPLSAFGIVVLFALASGTTADSISPTIRFFSASRPTLRLLALKPIFSARGRSMSCAARRQSR
jgi:hypothetical protein